MKNSVTDELNNFKNIISRTDSASFNGHTEFCNLTPEQRLDWLAELVVFVYESRSFRFDVKKQK